MKDKINIKTDDYANGIRPEASNAPTDTLLKSIAF
jgi:hypothetical protein